MLNADLFRFEFGERFVQQTASMGTPPRVILSKVPAAPALTEWSARAELHPGTQYFLQSDLKISQR